MDLHSKELYPLLVSQIQGVDDTPEVRESIWTKARSLAQDIQDLLLSDEIKEYIFEKSQESSLSEGDVEHFSRLIRVYFFQEDTPSNIAAGIGALFHRDAVFGKRILEEIESLQIAPQEDELAIDPAFEASVAPTELLTLESGAKKFPQVLKQLVTTEKIISKPFLNPLSPTVRNWIAVYEKISGVKEHGAIERGEFLYRSQACKALSDTDRNKLAQLLGARDEGSELLFDAEKGGILWQKKADVTEQKNTTPTATPAQQVSPATAPVENSMAQEMGVGGKPTPVASPTPAVAPGATGVDGSFSPNISRKNPSVVNENGDPQIVTRPRMPLGAARGGSHVEAVPAASHPETAPAVKKPPQFVGSARNNLSQESATKQTAEALPETPREALASLQNFAQQNKPPLESKAEDNPQKNPSLSQTDDLQVNFSSGQTLPAEKAKVSPAPVSDTPSPVEAPAVPAQRRSPFHIDPMGRRG